MHNNSNSNINSNINIIVVTLIASCAARTTTSPPSWSPVPSGRAPRKGACGDGRKVRVPFVICSPPCTVCF